MYVSFREKEKKRRGGGVWNLVSRCGVVWLGGGGMVGEWLGNGGGVHGVVFSSLSVPTVFIWGWGNFEISK